MKYARKFHKEEERRGEGSAYETLQPFALLEMVFFFQMNRLRYVFHSTMEMDVEAMFSNLGVRKEISQKYKCVGIHS